VTTAALDCPRLGSTEARIFTPPLPLHVRDDYKNAVWRVNSRGDGYWCGHTHIDGLNCSDTWGYDCIEFL
jgi:hypothetical protein